MTTKLVKPLKREIQVSGEPYVLTIDTDGLLLTAKGRRKGITLAWKDLLSGEAALAVALNASLTVATTPTKKAARPQKSVRKRLAKKR